MLESKLTQEHSHTVWHLCNIWFKSENDPFLCSLHYFETFHCVTHTPSIRCIEDDTTNTYLGDHFSSEKQWSKSWIHSIVIVFTHLSPIIHLWGCGLRLAAYQVVFILVIGGLCWYKTAGEKGWLVNNKYSLQQLKLLTRWIQKLPYAHTHV